MKDHCDLKNCLAGGGTVVGPDGYKSSWRRYERLCDMLIQVVTCLKI